MAHATIWPTVPMHAFSSSSCTTKYATAKSAASDNMRKMSMSVSIQPTSSSSILPSTPRPCLHVRTVNQEDGKSARDRAVEKACTRAGEADRAARRWVELWVCGEDATKRWRRELGAALGRRSHSDRRAAARSGAGGLYHLARVAAAGEGMARRRIRGMAARCLTSGDRERKVVRDSRRRVGRPSKARRRENTFKRSAALSAWRLPRGTARERQSFSLSRWHAPKCT